MPRPEYVSESPIRATSGSSREGAVDRLQTMPIIIDEIVISVEVANQAAAGAVPPAPDVDTHQLIVQQCVERVLEILRAREER
jgi:hypothetical protein